MRCKNAGTAYIQLFKNKHTEIILAARGRLAIEEFRCFFLCYLYLMQIKSMKRHPSSN